MDKEEEEDCDWIVEAKKGTKEFKSNLLSSWVVVVAINTANVGCKKSSDIS